MDEAKQNPLYANTVEVTLGPFDVVFDFGFKTPESTKKQSPDFDHVARIAMSLAHAKTMVPILTRLIAEYEQNFGPITAPGFDEKSKD